MGDLVATEGLDPILSSSNANARQKLETENWDSMIKKFNNLIGSPLSKNQVLNQNTGQLTFSALFKEVVLTDQTTGLPEREWYSELLTVHLSRAENIRLASMPTNRFDRRICQIHEQFKFLIFSVSCLVFGIEASSIALPLDDDSLAGADASIQEGSIGSLDHSKISKKQHYSKPSNNFESQLNVNEEANIKASPKSMYFKNMPFSKDPLAVRDLPNSQDERWKRGFIWKGLYFRLLFREEGLFFLEQLHLLKEEIYPQISNKPYQITENTFVCTEIGMMVLTDLSSMFLFATPIIHSEYSTFQRNLIDPISVPFETGLQIGHQARTLPMKCQQEKVQKAVLHLIFEAKRVSISPRITGYQADRTSSAPFDIQHNSINGLFSYLQTVMPSEDEQILKRNIWHSIQKLTKKEQTEGIFE